MARFEKFAAFIAARKMQFATMAIGILGNKAMVWAVNYGLDPYLIATFGLVNGGVAVMIASFFICFATIKFYDWSKRDWLGIEMAKEMKEYEGKKYLGRAIAWLLRKGDVVALVGLSILTDPFITTVYLRHGANQYNGMGRREWVIFLASTVVGNVSWVLTVFGGIKAFQFIF